MTMKGCAKKTVNILTVTNSGQTHSEKAKQKMSCMDCDVFLTMYNKLCKENSQHPHILTVSNLRKQKSESEAPQREVAKSKCFNCRFSQCTEIIIIFPPPHTQMAQINPRYQTDLAVTIYRKRSTTFIYIYPIIRTIYEESSIETDLILSHLYVSGHSAFYWVNLAS